MTFNNTDGINDWLLRGALALALAPRGLAAGDWPWRGLTCVDEGVLLHVRLLVEAFAAVRAGVGPGVRVYQQVSGQGGRALEDFPTDCTAKRPFLKQPVTACMCVYRITCIIHLSQNGLLTFPLLLLWDLTSP